MVTKWLRLPGVLGAMLCLPACAPIVALLGSTGSVVQVALQLDRIKLAGDGVSYLGSGKTITDHVVSAVIGADCRLLNVVSPDPVCKQKRNESAERLNARMHLAAANDQLLNGDGVAPAPALPRSAGEGVEELPTAVMEPAE